MNGLGNSAFSSLDEVGGIPLKKFTGEYDSNGDQVFTQGTLYFESIRRFKGQQSPAVILVDVLPNGKTSYQYLLFTGMTRATMRLEIVMDEDSPSFIEYQKKS